MRGARDAQGVLVGNLAQQVLGSLAVSFDERLAEVVDVMGNAPSLEAYEAFDAGMELYYPLEDVGGAVQQFLRAFEIDTTFLSSLVYAMYSARNDSSLYSVYDSLRTVLYGRRDELSPYDAYMVEAVWADGQGDYTGQIAALGRAAEIAPGSKASYNYARALVLANRPRQAIEILTTTLQPETGAMRGWWSYWQMLGLAYHLAGEYELELEVTEQARELYPRSIIAAYSRGEALAATGRVGDILILLDEAATFESSLWGRPGEIMLAVSLALSAHGFEEGARQVAERALLWFESRPSGELSTFANRYWIGMALYVAGRVDDARLRLQRLADEVQLGQDFQAHVLTPPLAVVSARCGDPADAQRLLDSLVTVEGPRSRTVSLQLAYLAEVLGDKDQAVAFLREYFTDIGFDFTHVYLPSLRGYPPFQELMRPKG